MVEIQNQLNSVISCSPYRVLIARLAAAQAAAEEIILEHTTDKVLVADK